MLTKQLVGLQRAGLDLINISLDTLRADRYEIITRRKGLERVLMGIDLALQLGYSPVKINCVVIKGSCLLFGFGIDFHLFAMLSGFNEDEILNFVRLTENKNVCVRFIEYMPFSGNKWDLQKFIPYREMVELIKNEFPGFRPLENAPNDVQKVQIQKILK